MNVRSSERVQRYRQRQREAGRKRITPYIDSDTQRKLDQLAGDQAQADFIEELLKATIEREWAALVSRQMDDHPTKATPTAEGAVQKPFPGRRRSLSSG